MSFKKVMGCSTIFQASTKDKMNTLINPPFPTGAITQSKSFNVPAPSSLAASKSSSGIPLKICVRNTVPKGRNAIGRISASHVSKSFS